MLWYPFKPVLDQSLFLFSHCWCMIALGHAEIFTG